MLVCDKCGKRINNPDNRTRKTLVIYQRAAAYIGHEVDLCDECDRAFRSFIEKAESYFMTNEDPIKLFDNVGYWSEN